MDKTHCVVIGWKDTEFTISETDMNYRMVFGPYSEETAKAVARCCNHAYKLGGEDKLAAIRDMLGAAPK